MLRTIIRLLIDTYRIQMVANHLTFVLSAALCIMNGVRQTTSENVQSALLQEDLLESSNSR